MLMSAFPLLPRMVAARMFAELCMLLPPPVEATQESLDSRDVLAVAAIDALGPIMSVEEASMALIVVAADFHARDALRGAGEHRDTLKSVLQCRAQALSMIRQRHLAATKLAALQARRRAAPMPADPVLVDAGQADPMPETEVEMPEGMPEGMPGGMPEEMEDPAEAPLVARPGATSRTNPELDPRYARALAAMAAMRSARGLYSRPGRSDDRRAPLGGGFPGPVG